MPIASVPVTRNCPQFCHQENVAVPNAKRKLKRFGDAIPVMSAGTSGVFRLYPRPMFLFPPINRAPARRRNLTPHEGDTVNRAPYANR